MTAVASSDSALSSQAEVTAEIEEIAASYVDGSETQPRLDYPPYRSSLLRHPTKAPQQADPEGVELWAPVFGERDLDAARGRPDHPARRRAASASGWW